MYQEFINPITGNVSSISKVVGNEVMSIPLNPDNTDYQEYLEWLAEGNTPEPAE
jgi:hypothetical protein